VAILGGGAEPDPGRLFAIGGEMTGARRAGRNGVKVGFEKPLEEPKEAALLDLEHLRRQCLGDQSLADELLREFHAQSLMLAGRLAEGDAAAVAPGDLAHRLRGAALAVGAWRVARAAEAVEAIARTGGKGPSVEMSRAVSNLVEAVLRTAEEIGRVQP